MSICQAIRSQAIRSQAIWCQAKRPPRPNAEHSHTISKDAQHTACLLLTHRTTGRITCRLTTDCDRHTRTVDYPNEIAPSSSRHRSPSVSPWKSHRHPFSYLFSHSFSYPFSVLMSLLLHLLHLLHLFSSLCANTAKRIKQLRIAAETAPELERSWIDDNDPKPNDLKELKKST